MSEQALHRWSFGLALAFTAYGIVRVGVLPIDAPPPRPIDPILLSKLQQPGWQVQSTVASQRRFKISNAKGIVLVQSKTAKPKGVQLSLVPVRSRSSDQLDAETIAREITGRSPLEGRTLKIGDQQLLFFENGMQRQMASSCIVSGKARSSGDEAARAIATPPATWRNRMETTIGLRPLRDWSCLFATISTPNTKHGRYQTDPDRVIKRVWADVKPVLTKRTASS
jgi:hypothetical protein